MATEKMAYKLLINVGGTKTSETQNLSPGKTARIKAQAGVRYQLQDANKNDAPPEQVRVKRVGKDLHVALGEGEEAAQLIIEDYYGVMPEGFNALVGQAEGGSFYEYVLEAPTTDSYTLSLVEGQEFTSAVLGGSEVSGSGAALAVLAFNPLLAAGAAAGAAGAAAGGGGTTAPAATVDTTPPAAPGLKVDDRDANGKINASGTAEIGSTVTVTWPDGSTSTTTAGPDGTWAVESPSVQQSGTVKATATDVSNNTGPEVQETYSAALPNVAPTAVTLDNKITTLPENTDTTTRVKVADIAVADDGQGTNTITLTGTDASKFEVVGNALYLKAGEVLDYESGKTQYDVTVNVVDSTVSGSQPVTVSYSLGVSSVNEAPTAIALSANAITENAIVGTGVEVGTLTVTDPDASGNNNVLTVDDTTNFKIENGKLIFIGSSPDFETKPSYSVTVTSTDGSLVKSETFTVNVSNVNEAPTAIALSANAITENVVVGTGVEVGTLTVTDPDANGNNNVLTVDDTTNFKIENGKLIFIGSSPDFETKPSYTVTVTSTDGSLVKSETFTVNVSNVNETPTVTAATQSVTVVESGGIANVVAGAPTATIALTKDDPDGAATVSYDTVWMASNGWTATTPGAIYTKVGTYGTATFTVTTGVVSYALDNTKLATQQLTEGQQVSDSFTVQVTDGTAMASTNAVFSITGTNDLPSITPKMSNNIWGTYIENNTLGTLISNSTLISDVDSPNLSGATVQITDMLVGDKLLFVGTAGFTVTATATSTGTSYALQGGITAVYTTSTGTLALSGDATLSAYALALRSIRFASSSDDPTDLKSENPDTQRSISWQLNDGTGNSESQTSTINISAVNDKPVLTSTVAAVAFTENSAPVLANNGIVLSDVDSTMLSGATVTISSGLQDGDVLAMSTITGITAAYANGVLTLTGDATIAQYQAALNAVTFSNASDALSPGSLTRALLWQVKDNAQSLSGAKTTFISVIGKNDAPVLDASVDVQMAPVVASSGVQAAAPVGAVGTLVSDLVKGVTDADGVTALKGISVIGMNRFHGVGYYSLDNGTTWLTMDAAGVEVSSINGRMLPFEARIYYAPAADFVGTVSDAFMFRAWDQTGNSSTDVSAAGQVFNTGTNGGATPYSVGTDTISITVTPFMGTSAVDTLTGGIGNDTLVGNGGADVISGGAGNDTVVLNASNVTALAATNSALIDGGADVNVLKLDVTATGITLDLTNATVAAKVNNFSVVDIKGSGNNTLKLALQDVLDMGGVADNVATAGVNEGDMLVVKGDAGDVVQLQAVASWAQTGAQSGATLATTFGAAYGFEAGHTYMQYTQGTANLFVDELMTRTLL